MKAVLTGFECFLLLATALPFVRRPYWWIRIFDFPRFQLAFLLLLTIVLHLSFFYPHSSGGFVLIGLLSVALLVQMYFIYQFTPFVAKRALAATKTDKQNRIRMMMANVKMDNTNYRRLLDIARDTNPDLFLLCEPNRQWCEGTRELAEAFPHSVLQPLENTYGMMLYSKLPLEDTEVRFQVMDGIPSIFTTVVLRSGQRIRLYCLHPQPPQFNSNTEDREAELLMTARIVQKSGEPSIVAGDLNDVGWSYTTKLFQRISGLLDPRIGRGFFNTYSVFVPFFRYPLDHVFYSEHFKLVDLKKLPRFGSDHFPVCIELQYEPDAAHQQEVPQADAADQAEAQEMIEEGLEKAGEKTVG